MSDEAVGKAADLVIQRSWFLEQVAGGCPLELAAYEVDWSPHQLREQLADQDFAILVDHAENRGLDEVERALMDMARNKNLGAIQMVLYNRRSSRWKDVKRVETHSTHEVGPATIAAVRGSVMEAIRLYGPAPLQIGGALDQKGDDDILDGEVVGEG